MPAKSFAESLQNILQIVLNHFETFFKKALTIFVKTDFLFPHMKHLRFFKMTVALVASLLSAGSTFAQSTITSFEAEPQMLRSASGIWTEGSFGRQGHSLPNSTVSAQIDLNEADTSVTLRRVEFDIEDFELSGDFVVSSGGFGGTRVTNTISGTIDFDPLVFTDNEALTTTLQADGRHQINGFQRYLGNVDQPDITGSYQFSGPTESVEGTFSFDLVWQRYHIPPIIDTTDYPNSVTINEDLGWLSSSNFNLVTGETIDGVDISVGFQSQQFFASDDFELKAMIIPEPSEYALMIGGLLIAFIAFRRMKFLRSAMI